jgi:hypothetical protein
MESHFFNDKNINNMTSLLIKELNIKDDPEIKKKCKRLVHEQMKEVYGKYGRKRPEGMKSADFLNALNKKSVKQSIAICEASKNKKKQTKESSLSELKQERDAMTFNARNLKQPPRRPESTNKGSDGREMLFNDTNNMSNFASFDTKESAQYIRADGSISRDAPTDWDADNINNDRNKKDDLERAMKEREKDYSQSFKSNPRGNGQAQEGRNNDFRDNRQLFNSGRNNDFGNNFGNNNFGNNNFNDNNFNDNNFNDNNFNDNNFNDNNFNDNYDDNNYGNSNFTNDNNYGNSNFGNDNQNNEHFNNDTELKSRYNDVLASRNALDTMKKPPPKNFNPSTSPYQNKMNDEHYEPQNYNQQRPVNQTNNPLSPNHKNNQNYSDNQNQNFNKNPQRNYNQNYNQNYNHPQHNQNQTQSHAQNYNQNYDEPNHLNGPREVLSPLYSNIISKEEMINLDSEQLDAYIEKMKNKISTQINLSNFDPNCLQNLSSVELKELINKISLDLSGINNIIDNTSRPSTFQTHDHVYQQNPYNPPQYNEPSITNTVRELDIPKNNDTGRNKYVDILIKSNEWDAPENYNDYMIEFKSPYTHVTSFQLLNLKLPPIANIVTIDNNNIKLLLNDDEINKSITPNMYDLPNLINSINMYLAPYFNVFVANDRVTIQNTANTKFDLANGDRSIFKLLGFKKSNYIDKSSYISEEEPIFGSNRDVYLFIEGIKDEEAIFKFKSMENPNNLCPVTLTLDKPIEELSEIFIKFKYEDNVESNKNVNFYGKPHEMLIRLGQ